MPSKYAHYVSLAITLLLTLVAIRLFVDRLSVIPGFAVLCGIVLLIKIGFYSSHRNLLWSIGLAGIFVLAWFGTFTYVIATYESGEVVELEIATDAGSQLVRTWVMDVDAENVVYYDAPPELAESLLAGHPVQFTRRGVVSTRTPIAVPVEDLPGVEVDRLLGAMAKKYPHQMIAADVYYVLLGKPRDRIGLVIRL